MNNRTFKYFSYSLFCLGLMVSFNGCDGFFGEKTEIDFIDEPQYDERQLAYVPIQPVLIGFLDPIAVVAGYDELIYVGDAGTEEVISFDQAGNELGRFKIPGLTGLAQDRTLDIVATGRVDTMIGGNSYSLAAIFRIEQKKNGAYGLQNAFIEKRQVHPFYFKVSFEPGKDPLVNFTGIAVRPDNQYYVLRNGPNSSILGPDDAVLLFDTEPDTFITPITVKTTSGFFNNYFVSPRAIAAVAQPPQSPAVNTDLDFVYTSGDPSATLQVQYINVNVTEGGVDYTVREMAAKDTSKASGFLSQPYRFGHPAGVAYSGDGTNYIFVIDSEKDSLYQFTNTGLEGIKPPAPSQETKHIPVSFGGTGKKLTQFQNPKGVAYLNKIVYVADAGNGRVLRFKLTTDFD